MSTNPTRIISYSLLYADSKHWQSQNFFVDGASDGQPIIFDIYWFIINHLKKLLFAGLFQ